LLIFEYDESSVVSESLRNWTNVIM